MLEHLIDAPEQAVPLVPLTRDGWQDWLTAQTQADRAWIASAGFAPDAGALLLMPRAGGGLDRVLFGLGEREDPWHYGALPAKLPGGTYRLECTGDATMAATAWALGCYRFDRYRTEPGSGFAELAWPDGADRAAVARAATATKLVRDMVNTPAEDMGPADLSAAADTLAAEFGAKVHVTFGDALPRENYPMIHAVGRASDRPPRLIDLRWGAADAGFKLTIVGKGVCFDTGGLDLKPSSGMRLMKKDMGGAAHALGLAAMVMMADLPVTLRVLIPAVDNAVSGNAFRPGDVLKSRKGLTVEIGNTDAEGRLVLADALAEAESERPDLLIDLATLTGAARVALGPEIPPFFTDDEALAETIARQARAQTDPLWRLPLHKDYRRMLDSKVADIGNVSDGPFAGAITAALFLAEFTGQAKSWVHVDCFAWNPAARPGRPEGGEAQGLRALFATILERTAVERGAGSE